MVLSLYFDVMLLFIEKRNIQQKKSKKKRHLYAKYAPTAREIVGLT